MEDNMGAVILANGEGGVGIAGAIRTLVENGEPLDAVEAGIRIVESDPSVRSVGVGGAPDILGTMACDACVMCGSTLRTGAVGALKAYVHAVSVARQVMERTPHVMLVGEGAARFAGEIGAEKGELLTDEARRDYARWLKRHVPAELAASWPDAPLAPLVQRPDMSAGADGPAGSASAPSRGTTTFLVRSGKGRTAGGVSTSGWAYRYPDRLGDSGIIGAGLYVDDRYGSAACTHTGEMTIRAGTARGAVAYMKKGATVEEACREAIDDLRALKGGTLGPVIIHALDRNGSPFVLSTGGDGGIPYWFWTEGMDRAEKRRPAIEEL
jgi:L-asparaginase / beta-aspartyl-peptidase